MAKWFDIDNDARINGKLTVNGDIVSTGIISGSSIRGDGSLLTNLPIPVATSTPISGSTNPISSGWAFTHESKIGLNGGHLPSAGTTAQFLRGDGTWQTPPNNYPTAISSTDGGNGTLTVSRNGLSSIDVELSHNHDSRYYTETEIDTKLSGKSDSTHNHDTQYLGINSKAKDADLLDGLDSGKFVRSDLDSSYDISLGLKSIANEINGLYVPMVDGGSHSSSTANVTGAIKITLPQSWTSTMMRFAVDVYDYANDKSMTIYIAGYNYSASSSWLSTTAYILGSHTDRNLNVRFGHDGTKCVVYIGELNSNWSYPQICVRDFIGGYNNYQRSKWQTGWFVGFESVAFGSVTSTKSNTLTESSYALDSDKLDGLDSSQFLRKDIDQVFSGNALTLQYGLITSNELPVINRQIINTDTSRIYIGNPSTPLTIESSVTPSVNISGTNYSLYHTGNFVAGDYVKNNTDNQSVNTGFNVRGSMVLGATGAGTLYVKNSSGSNIIHIAGDNASKTGTIKSYINANGDATFDGTLTANILRVSNTSVVPNLNAEKVGGVEIGDISRKEVAYEIGGWGIHSGFRAKQSGVGMQTQFTVESGIVYTKSGKRIDFAGSDYVIALPSTTVNNHRIDSIYIAGPSEGNNEGSLRHVQGTYSGSPVAPSIPSDGIKVAEIYMGSNQGTITDARITDKRVYKDVRYDNATDRLIVDRLDIDDISSSNSSIVFNKPIKNVKGNTSITFSIGQTSKTFTHNLGFTNYVVRYSCNSHEPHIRWTNKTANSVVIELDDVCSEDVVVDISLEAY